MEAFKNKKQISNANVDVNGLKSSTRVDVLWEYFT